jgi:hypothetical protein
MTEWQNLQVGVEVRKLDGIPMDGVGAPQFVEDIKGLVNKALTQALHEYFNEGKGLPVEHFAEFTTINVEVQKGEAPKHVIEVRGEYDWTLQHPIAERPDLISCPFNNALKVVWGKEPGKYFCTLEIMAKTKDGDGSSRAIPPLPVVILGERIDTESKEE